LLSSLSESTFCHITPLPQTLFSFSLKEFFDLRIPFFVSKGVLEAFPQGHFSKPPYFIYIKRNTAVCLSFLLLSPASSLHHEASIYFFIGSTSFSLVDLSIA